MTKALAYLSFEQLNARLTPNAHAVSIAAINKALGGTDYPLQLPVFVTWNKNHQLRGCIGTFQAADTVENVCHFALVSAFEDTRFSPISKSELPSLSVSVTILDRFEPIADPTDWEVGTHGLKVLFAVDGRSKLGTFLPSVAEEQEWDKTDTLWNLLRKAGYGRVSRADTLDFYRDAIAAGSMKLVRYEGLKSGADYAEWVEFSKSLK